MITRTHWFAAVVIGTWVAVAAGRVDADNLLAASIRHTIRSPVDGPRQYPSVVTALAIQPHGKLVAAAGDDHVIRLWNLDDGTLVRRLVGHTDWVRAVAFSPDGTTLVSSGDDRRVLSWNVAAGSLVAKLAEHNHAIGTVAFSHSGRWLVTAGFEDKLCILDLAQEAAEREIACGCTDLRAITVSDDDRHVAAAGRDGTIRIWDLSTAQLVREQKAHALRIRAIEFAQEGNQLISGGEDRRVRVWNWQTDDQYFELPEQPAKILALVTCGPQLVATAGSDNLVRLWDLSSRREVGRLTGHAGSVSALAYQGGVLVSGGFDTCFRIWQVPDQVEEGVRSAQRVQ